MAATRSTRSVVLALFLIIAYYPSCRGQLSPEFIKILLNSLNITQKASFIAQFLVDHEPLFHQLEDILIAGFPLLSLETNYPQGLVMHAVLPWALSHVPDLLQSPEFLGIVTNFVEEVNKVNYTILDSNSTDKFVSGLFSSMDWLRFLEKSLSLTRSQYSIRALLPYSENHTLSYQCYNDTMDFIERLLYGSDWAVNMFDAIGKPTTGIRKGVMHFIGTYDQCMEVKANLNVGVPLGPYNSTINRQFGTKYCRATFPLPQSIIDNIAGEHVNHTYGIPLRLTWGLCLPDSCSEKDITGLVHLGILERFDISVEEAVCTKDNDFTADRSAQALVGVFSALILLVVIGTLVDVFVHKKEDEEPVNFMFDPTFSISDIVQYGEEEPKKQKKKQPLERIISFRQDRPEANTYTNPTFEGEMVQSPKKHIVGGVQIPVVINGDVKLRRSRYFNENYEKVDPATEKEKNEAEGEEDDVPEKEPKKVYDDMSNSSVKTPTKESNSELAPESAVVKFFRAFSIYTNATSLLSAKEQADDIPCIYGIRFLSMTWILLGNTYVYNVLSLAEAPVAGDMMDTFKILKRFTFQVILAGTHAVDTFFMISGCLVTYWYIKRLEERFRKTGFKHWLKFYLGRYFKFTPAYMLVLALFSFLYMYLGHGPLWPERIIVGDKCRENWWHNLLYVNNFLDTEGTDAYSQCMSWSWFLAVLMQLYLISPVIFTIMSTSSTLGIVVGVLLVLSGIAATGVKAHQYPGDILSMRIDGGAYWNNVFIKPWCNVSSYAIGMILGLILQKVYHKKMHRILCGVCWVFSVCLGALIVYCTSTKYIDGVEPWTDVQKAVYEAVGRPAWSLCVAWVVYACDSGFGGFVNSILSWRGFVPLSRLTFMVYLLSPIIMVQRVYSMELLTYLGDMDMVYMFIGHTVISYAVAFVLSFVVDAPFRNLKRMLTNKYLKL